MVTDGGVLGEGVVVPFFAEGRMTWKMQNRGAVGPLDLIQTVISRLTPAED